MRKRWEQWQKCEYNGTGEKWKNPAVFGWLYSEIFTTFGVRVTRHRWRDSRCPNRTVSCRPYCSRAWLWNGTRLNRQGLLYFRPLVEVINKRCRCLAGCVRTGAVLVELGADDKANPVVTNCVHQVAGLSLEMAVLWGATLASNPAPPGSLSYWVARKPMHL